MMPTHDVPKVCPRCSTILQTLLFLGMLPDGYICAVCELYYTEDLQPVARVIGGEIE